MLICMKNKHIANLVDKWQKKGVSDLDFLATLFASFDTKRDLSELIVSLLTKQERKMLATRLLIIKKLKDNVPQHEIAKQLKVGVLTVTRGYKEIEKGRFKFIS